MYDLSPMFLKTCRFHGLVGIHSGSYVYWKIISAQFLQERVDSRPNTIHQVTLAAIAESDLVPKPRHSSRRYGLAFGLISSWWISLSLTLRAQSWCPKLRLHLALSPREQRDDHGRSR